MKEKHCIYCKEEITDDSRYYTDKDEPICQRCWDVDHWYEE